MSEIQSEIKAEKFSFVAPKIAKGTRVHYPIMKYGKPYMILEGVIEDEYYFEPGKYWVRCHDNVIRGPYYPDQLLPV